MPYYDDFCNKMVHNSYLGTEEFLYIWKFDRIVAFNLIYHIFLLFSKKDKVNSIFKILVTSEKASE